MKEERPAGVGTGVNGNRHCLYGYRRSASYEEKKVNGSSYNM